jgi:hypothetical protein
MIRRINNQSWQRSLGDELPVSGVHPGVIGAV